MKKVWTEKLDQYLKANYTQLTDQMISEKIKFIFNVNVTPGAVNSRRIRLKLKLGYKRPLKYTDEVRKYIINNYKGKSNIDLAKEVNDKFNLNVTNNGICMYKANLIRRYGINTRTGINPGCYPKGNIPVNKGTKGMFNVGGNSGSFKKENKPWGWQPIGTERIAKDDYIEIKYRDLNGVKNYMSKHRYLYEQKHGPIPKNHIVIFADGNKRNFSDDNLICISKKQNATLNKLKLRGNNLEQTTTAINLVNYIQKVNDIKNEGKK